ncbi:MAG: hypothetical protein ACK41T_00280 [Pseudobdellovibrio sp.]
MALKNLSEIKPENIRKTTVPLQIDLIKEYFENKDKFFVIDYANSQIKGNMFLTYLSNLDLPCEIDLSTATKEEKFDLIKTYMETRNINPSDVLKLTVAEIILTYKLVKTEGLFVNSSFTEEEKVEFIQSNLDLLRKWDQFLYSCLIYLMKIHPDLNEKLQADSGFDVITDPHWLGLNVINLFGITGFTELYYSSTPWEPLKYFKPQFEEYMYKGKNLFYYFNCEENTMVHLMGAVLNGRIDVNDLIKFVTQPSEA